MPQIDVVVGTYRATASLPPRVAANMMQGRRDARRQQSASQVRAKDADVLAGKDLAW